MMTKSLYAKVCKDKQLVTEGCTLLRKGIIIGAHGIDDTSIDSSVAGSEYQIGVGCYLLEQGIEMLIKGLCEIFGEALPAKHNLALFIQTLNELYESKIPEFVYLSPTFEIMSKEFVAYVQLWQVSGRFSSNIFVQTQITKVKTVYENLVCFIRNNDFEYLFELRK